MFISSSSTASASGRGSATRPTRKIAWVYSIGFEHTYGQPEVVIAGFGRIHTSRMLDAIAGLYERSEALTEGEVIARVDEDDVVFRTLHPEWLSGTNLVAGADWLNRGATRARQLVGSAPGGVPWPEQPRLWLPPEEQSIRELAPLHHPGRRRLAHPLPWDTPVYVHRTIDELQRVDLLGSGTTTTVPGNASTASST